MSNELQPVKHSTTASVPDSCLLDTVPIDIQNTIQQFTAINYDMLSFDVKKYIDPDCKYIGKILFSIQDKHCDDYPTSLGTFIFEMDTEYRSIWSINEYNTREFFNTLFDNGDMDYEKFVNPFKGFFINFHVYYHENFNTFINKSFLSLIKFIFTYEKSQFSTISVAKNFVNKCDITGIKNFEPFEIKDKLYLFNKFKMNALFENDKIPIYPCTLLIQNAKQYQSKKGRFQYVHNGSYFDDNGTLMYDRKCVILQNNHDHKVYVYFNQPCIFVGLGSIGTDILFKLSIDGKCITGDNFCFDRNNLRDDWDYRINKYSTSENPNGNIIYPHDMHLYWFVQSRWRNGRYNYDEFEKKIRDSELKTINIQDANHAHEWDSQMQNALTDLLSFNFDIM